MSRACVLTLVATAGVSGGCVANAPVCGWIPRPTIGNPVMDFTFIDDRGSTRSLRKLLGDFTVLAFTRCDKDTHRPAVEVLASVVRDNRSAPFIRVVAVHIHRPANTNDRDGRCYLAQADATVASICDGTGAVCQLYGAGDEDWLLLIDPNGCISFSGPMHAVDQLRTELDQGVARLRATKLSGHGVHRGRN